MRRIVLAALGVVALFGVAACGGGSNSGTSHDITGDWTVAIQGRAPAFMRFEQDESGNVTGRFDDELEKIFTSQVVGSLADDTTGRYEITAKLEMFWPAYVFIDAVNYHINLDGAVFSGTCDAVGPGGVLLIGLPCQGTRI